MANHKSAIKRIRQTLRRQIHNRMFRNRTRTMVKKARVVIAQGDKNAALEVTKAALRELDKAVSKGIIHKRNAARRKSRLQKRLNTLQA
jgi:small subunit ribosomal protein S20